jgi:hypothetical protein
MAPYTFHLTPLKVLSFTEGFFSSNLKVPLTVCTVWQRSSTGTGSFHLTMTLWDQSDFLWVEIGAQR